MTFLLITLTILVALLAWLVIVVRRWLRDGRLMYLAFCNVLRSGAP